MAMSMEHHESSGKYWTGFAAGAFIGTSAAIAAVYIANLMSGRDRRIVRLEDSIQIARPVSEVFRSWINLEELPQHLEYVNNIRVAGQTSEWDVTVDGRDFKWRAKTVQLIPNEAIAWKSVTGPKHSGRINFSKLGDDTLMHVTMNYAPPLGRFGRALSAVDDNLEGYVAKSLRDFKHALEEKGVGPGSDSSRAEWRSQHPKATGTTGRAKP
jgi:uncharacterized membrane protein